MAKIHTIHLPFTMVESASSTGDGTFFPGSPWMAAALVGKVRPTYELVYRTGNLTVAFAYQVCDVETSQASATYLTSYNASGVNFPSSGYYDISATTSTKQMVRFGWLVKLSTGSTQSFGYVGGSVAIMECD